MNDDRRRDPDEPRHDDDRDHEEQGVLEFLNGGEDPENLDLLDDEDLAEMDLDSMLVDDGESEAETPPPAPAREERRPRASGPEVKATPRRTAVARENGGGRRFPPAMIAAAVVIAVGAVLLLNPFRSRDPLPQEGPRSTLLTAVPDEADATPDSVPQSGFEEMDTITHDIVPETPGAAVGDPEAAPEPVETAETVADERPTADSGGQALMDPEAGTPGPAAPAVPGPDGGLCIQVGVGADAEGANREAARLTERGHRALVTEVTTARGTSYRIVVGYFESSTAATAYLDHYKNELPQGSWVRSR